MASIKIKFRASSVPQKEGSIYYQVIHNRTARQISTGYKLFPNEWNNSSAQIIFPPETDRKNYLAILKKKVEEDNGRLERIIILLDRKNTPYTSQEVIDTFSNQETGKFLFPFMLEIIEQLKQSGKIRTAETYTTTLNSFIRFRESRDIMLEEIDSGMMKKYESFLETGENVSRNTVSFYMRILRAVYNRGVDKEITTQRYPFRHVYTGIEKTQKRALPIRTIRQVKEAYLATSPSMDYARDLFMFSFYTRGMSFIDMTYLKKKDLQNGILTYRRKKTGQQLFIKWEKYMQEIVDKYPNEASEYLLPIIRKSEKDKRRQYMNASHLVNRKLKDIGKLLELPLPLTMYVARHSWASIAKSKNVPVSVISEGMGHDSEATTLIYLTSLDTAAIDNANSMILKSL